MKYIIFAFIFLIPLRCMSEKLVFLDEVQTKTMNVAFSHFREHTNWGLFNTMIQDLSLIHIKKKKKTKKKLRTYIHVFETYIRAQVNSHKNA
ncbi:hypothetical protein [Salmonella enterica]